MPPFTSAEGREPDRATARAPPPRRRPERSEDQPP